MFRRIPEWEVPWLFLNLGIPEASKVTQNPRISGVFTPYVGLFDIQNTSEALYALEVT
jgi:hypothetical protein